MGDLSSRLRLTQYLERPGGPKRHDRYPALVDLDDPLFQLDLLPGIMQQQVRALAGICRGVGIRRELAEV